MALPPDVIPYRELTLDGRNADDLLAAALDLATTRLPGWSPRAGNTEVVVLEAVSLIGAELVYALNEVPGVVVEGVASLLGVQRSAGEAAAAEVRLEVADAGGHTIPAGLRLSVPVGADQVVLETVEDAIAAPGERSVTVQVRAIETGAATNGAGPGTRASVLDGVPFLDGAVLATTLAGGSDPEDDAAYAARGISRAARITTTLVLPSHFEQAALERTGVDRALAVNLYDPRQAGVPGDHLGHVTVAAANAGGLPLPTADAEQLRADLAGASVAGLAVHVTAPTVTEVPLQVSVTRNAGYSAEEVIAAVQLVVRDYLSPGSWDWSPVVRRNELIARIDAALGVDLVVDLTPSADVLLPGVAPLVRAGVIEVEVVTA